MMATNVTQKDKTLHELITWLERQRDTLEVEIHDAIDIGLMYCYGLCTKQDAYTDVLDHCREMLDYSGNIPLEVQNQNEGTESC